MASSASGEKAVKNSDELFRATVTSQLPSQKPEAIHNARCHDSAVPSTFDAIDDDGEAEDDDDGQRQILPIAEKDSGGDVCS